MKDRQGEVLEVGDFVFCISKHYRDLTIGKVISIRKKAKIETYRMENWNFFKGSGFFTSNQIIKCSTEFQIKHKLGKTYQNGKWVDLYQKTK